MRVIDVPSIRGRKKWRANFVEMEHFLRSSFVLCKKMRVRTRTGVWKFQQIHISGNVHFFGVVASIGFSQIEYQVGAAFSQSVERLWPTVQHIIRRFVPKLS